MTDTPSRFPSPPPTLRDLPRSRRSRFHHSRFTVPPGPPTHALAVSLVVAGGTAAYGITSPFLRAGLLVACGLLVYVMGVFQPRPR